MTLEAYSALLENTRLTGRSDSHRTIPSRSRSACVVMGHTTFDMIPAIAYESQSGARTPCSAFAWRMVSYRDGISLSAVRRTPGNRLVAYAITCAHPAHSAKDNSDRYCSQNEPCVRNVDAGHLNRANLNQKYDQNGPPESHLHGGARGKSRFDALLQRKVAVRRKDEICRLGKGARRTRRVERRGNGCSA